MMMIAFVDAHRMAQAMSRPQVQTSNFGDIGLQDLGSVPRAAMLTDSYSVFTIHHSVSWIGIIGLVSAVVIDSADGPPNVL